ncbi:MAG: DUF1571 domain-containing protein [Syntrophobacteraceae bacterium]
MRYSAAFLPMIVLIGLLCWGPQAHPSPGSDPGRAVLTLLTQLESSYAGIEDYTAVFQKQERVDGELLPEETILLKFQKPLKVYMKWIEGPHQGREALYVEGENENKMIAHEGGIRRFITLSLAPAGPSAMEGNRHPITEVGFGHILDGLHKDIKTAVEHDELEIIRIGEEQFKNRSGIILEARSVPRGERKYYASRMVLHVDRELMLPVDTAFYDDKGDLFERYVYTDVRLNVGFTSKDFSRDNSAYGF